MHAMHKARLGEPFDGGKLLQLGYMETDPSLRYGRFRDILGKGAMKTVYKAFDEVLGMEVAWNQVKLNDVFRSPDELQRLYSEVHLLKNLDHDSLIRFHASWIDLQRRTFNFITEMFTSGTLREYTQKYKRVNIGAVKNWARQILRGLAYLHSRDPPVIHRDLKCDNIFVNGHLGQVKIGDLGLAAKLRGSQHAHSVIGTPEFMAPELYEEEYNELVDIYSFGMCVLEMLTSEYPYSECSNPAQIYKKVTSGKLPEAFYRIQDVEAREFVGKCLQSASKRPPAQDLLLDPFLALDELEDHLFPIPRAIATTATFKETALEGDPPLVGDHPRSTDMSITGSMNPEDDTIFLKVQISDKNHGHARNIYFPFDIMNDTAVDVASEMVKELEINDWEPSEIALMIEDQISSLVSTGKEWGSSLNHNQDSFSDGEDGEVDDDDDDETYNPFYSFSNRASPQGYFPGLGISYETQNMPPRNYKVSAGHDWCQGNLINSDDASSQSSSNSYKYSNYNYCSGNEDDVELSPRSGEPLFTTKTHKSTRFCPAESMNDICYKRKNLVMDPSRAFRSNRRITRMRSLVDVRSQLLHRSLVEEINKRRLFKTVGAVENIGFHDPKAGAFSGKMLECGGSSGRSTFKNEKQGFEW